MEDITVKELYELLEREELNSEDYKNIAKRCNYTHEQLANMIFFKRTTTLAWSCGQKQPTKACLKLLILELIARKKGYKSAIEMAKSAVFNEN